MPFDYRYAGGQGARDYYDENNAWTYIWDVQHALPELVEMLGGHAGAQAKLDRMFNEPYGRARWSFYNLENGRKFVIEAPAASQDAKYIQALSIDGQPSNGTTVLRHADILRGAHVKIEMSARPSPTWGR